MATLIVGPLPATFNDFWRTVWELRSSVVVMLTNLQEKNKVCSHLMLFTVFEALYWQLLLVNLIIWGWGEKLNKEGSLDSIKAPFSLFLAEMSQILAR